MEDRLYPLPAESATASLDSSFRLDGLPQSAPEKSFNAVRLAFLSDLQRNSTAIPSAISTLISAEHSESLATLFPGQGSQRRGMGRDLFPRFQSQVEAADSVLGYSIERLCLEDPERQLTHTAFTQPALYVVGALHWLERRQQRASPRFLAGHSLGEYVALFAAGCFSFEAGLRLVRERGTIMARMGRGSMTAVLGLDVAAVESIIADAGSKVDIANYNSSTQLVLAGDREHLDALVKPLTLAGATRVLPLNVSGAFHSRCMRSAANDFARVLAAESFQAPTQTVLANVTAAPYPSDSQGITDLLAQQIASPVRWADTMAFLRRQGVDAIEELGPGRVLAGLWKASRTDPSLASTQPETRHHDASPSQEHAAIDSSRDSPGADAFRRDYDTRLAYVAGSTMPGVFGHDAIVSLCSSRLLGFLDDYSPTPKQAIDRVAATAAGPWGVSLRPDLDEHAVIEAALSARVGAVEVAGYRSPGPELIRLGRAGLRVLALVDDLEQAAAFLDIATDLCVMGDLLTLLPSVLELRDRHKSRVRVGAGGPLGTPAAVAAAFVLGADFVRSAAVNLGSRESRLPALLKTRLLALEPGDTILAPASLGFEHGVTQSVLKKGSLFAPRAQKLYDLYRLHESLDDLPAGDRTALEQAVFGKPLGAISNEVNDESAPQQDVRTRAKAQMARVFRWYLDQSMQWTLEEGRERVLDLHVPCDESLATWRLTAGPELSRCGLVDIAEHLMSAS